MSYLKIRTFAILVAVGLLALLGSSTSSAQSGTIFKVASIQPIVAHSSVSGTWDDRYTDPGAVMYYNGKFHMFRNGFRNWPASVQWGYVTSEDGYTWTKQGDQPVFTTDQVPYSGVASLASSVLVRDDGTWVIYFYTYGAGPGSTWAIGRATAPGPTGPWSADPAPVLKPGGAGSWDDRQVTSPSVVHTDTGYVMYYGGFGANLPGRIGMATSPDGIAWTKYNNPATTDALYAESDPVIEPDLDGWDSHGIEEPHVLHTTDGWVVLYRAGGIGGDRNFGLGYALSSDGIHWNRSANNPILQARDIPGTTAPYFINMVYHNGTYFVTWELTKGNALFDVSDIYLATHDGPLPATQVNPPTETPTTGTQPTPEPTSAATIAPAPSPTTQVVPTVAIPGANSRTFPETGKSVKGIFLDYWDKNGGLAQQGFPISDMLGEISDLNGKPYTVQYFERAVFEYHPEEQAPYNVLLSQLGTFQYKKKYPNGAPNQKVSSEADAVLFPETGKHLGGKFLAYWKTNGGLAQQGYPISEEFTEVSDLNGKPYTVQYFERAVFELHPENQSPFDVLLSQLGTFQYKEKYSH